MVSFFFFFFIHTTNDYFCLIRGKWYWFVGKVNPISCFLAWTITASFKITLIHPALKILELVCRNMTLAAPVEIASLPLEGSEEAFKRDRNVSSIALLTGHEGDSRRPFSSGVSISRNPGGTSLGSTTSLWASGQTAPAPQVQPAVSLATHCSVGCNQVSPLQVGISWHKQCQENLKRHF